MNVKLSRNGEIIVSGKVVGTWAKNENSRYNMSGQKLAAVTYEAHLINGENLFEYYKKDLSSLINQRAEQLYNHC